MSHDHKSEIDPTKTPLFIGAGVEFAGTIRHAGPHEERAVILGSLTGEIHWNGILQVPAGGKVIVQGALRCREMMIGGEIVGEGNDVLIETGLLRLGNSAKIDVATVCVPTGGLEQARGSVINAKLRMTSDHPFAPVDEVAQATEPLRLVSAAASPAVSPGSSLQEPAEGGADAGSPGGDAGQGNDLVQVETRTSGAQQLAA